MKAMVLKKYGANFPFELAELPQPAVKSGHVLIRIAATSVNTVDTKIRAAGKNSPIAPDLPALLGMDFAGVVESVGDGVTNFAAGDAVYGCAGGLADLPGALAEYIVADARLLAHKPKTLSMREAAALPLVAITAWEGLQRVGLKAGQKVLIHGGAGGVGHVATQLAKHWGADVYATGSGSESRSIIEGYGATAIDYREDSVVDYVAKHTGGAGFEVVFDTVGGDNMSRSFEAAALNGHVASTVAMVELDLTTTHLRGLTLHVVFMLIPMLHDPDGAMGRAAQGVILTELAELVDAGHVQPLVDPTRFGLEDVGAAHARLTSGKAVGKVVVDIQALD